MASRTFLLSCSHPAAAALVCKQAACRMRQAAAGAGRARADCCAAPLLPQAMVLVTTRDTLDQYGVGQASGRRLSHAGLQQQASSVTSAFPPSIADVHEAPPPLLLHPPAALPCRRTCT